MEFGVAHLHAGDCHQHPKAEVQNGFDARTSTGKQPAEKLSSLRCVVLLEVAVGEPVAGIGGVEWAVHRLEELLCLRGKPNRFAALVEATQGLGHPA